jgi:hypothetical protein
MIAPILLAAAIARGPVVPVTPAATVTDSWLCSHVSVFFCPMFPKVGSTPPPQRRVVEPRRGPSTAKS